MRFVITQSQRLNRAALLASLCAFAHPAAAEDAQPLIGGSLAVGSDYVFRGISQTMESPAVQASIDVESESGLYAYVWGSNVDFVPDGEPDDGASYEIDIALGYAHDLGEQWSIDVALIRYMFPGTTADADYDFNELIASLTFGDTFGAAVAYSNDVNGTGRRSLHYELGAAIDLGSATSFGVQYGHYDLRDAFGADYSYSEARLERYFGDASISFARIDTHGSVDAIFDHVVTGPRFIVTLQYDW